MAHKHTNPGPCRVSAPLAVPCPRWKRWNNGCWTGAQSALLAPPPGWNGAIPRSRNGSSHAPATRLTARTIHRCDRDEVSVVSAVRQSRSHGAVAAAAIAPFQLARSSNAGLSRPAAVVPLFHRGPSGPASGAKLGMGPGSSVLVCHGEPLYVGAR